jgi:AraC family transcriptional regulator
VPATPSATAAEIYRARFHKVLDYVDAHLEDDLPVDRLCVVAALSQYHFHRQFSALLGLGVYEYVQLMRLKRASYELAFRRGRRIIDIALQCGYESPEAFARAFKKRLNQTPSAFRKQPLWSSWHATYRPLLDLRSHPVQPNPSAEQVQVIDFPETHVATLEHHGDPRRIGDSIRRFIEWRQQNRLPPRVSATFNLLYNNPSTTAPQDFRLDLCAAVVGDVAANTFGVVKKTIPAGRCAVLRHVGSEDRLDQSLHYLYADWLPQSREELRDFPLFLQRVLFFPDVAENEAITDIFLPLK